MELLDRIDKLIPESLYGQKKSKVWLKYTKLIDKIKSAKELTGMLKELERFFKAGTLTNFELADLTNKALAKSYKL